MAVPPRGFNPSKDIPPGRGPRTRLPQEDPRAQSGPSSRTEPLNGVPMSGTALNNDRFPTDLRTLIIVCALLALLLPADRLQSFTGLLTLAMTVPERRR